MSVINARVYGLNIPSIPPYLIRTHASYNAKFTLILSHYHHLDGIGGLDYWTGILEWPKLL